MKKFLIFIFAILVFAVFAVAQTSAELAESAKLERQALADYKAKNYAKFLENIKRAGELRPNHPRLLYTLADAYALNDKQSEALTILERLAAMDLFFAIEKDDDFKSLFDLPEFKKIQSKFVENQKPLNNSQKAFSISNKDLIVESVAYDSASKRFFASSIHKRKIVAIDKDGKTSDFSSDADGLWSVSGIRVDEKRKILWAATTAFPQMQNFQKADDGKSGVFKYDLKTGKLLKKYLLSNENSKHALGDLVIAKNGDVYASDSVSPNIYRITSEKDELEIFLTNEIFSSLQGLAFSPDEKILFAADYSRGVFRIEMKDKRIVQIKTDANVYPISIDGLYFHRGNLIAIQNGFRPHRVARFFLNKDFSQITKCETLEANHADFNEPTLGVIVGNDFYYVANSQWNLTGEDGKLAADKLKETVILKLKF